MTRSATYARESARWPYLKEPRFAFVTGDRFDGLIDYATSPELKVKDREIKYPISPTQTSMFGFDKMKGVTTRLGNFYERVGKAIYGGEIKKSHEINGCDGGSLIVEPDITHEGIKSYRDAKGVQTRQSLILKDKQILDKYVRLMFKGSSAPERRLRYTGESPKVPHIYLEIFRHSCKGLFEKLKENKGRLEWLVRELSEGTRYMFSLPFSVIYRMYSNILETGSHGQIFNTRYDAREDDAKEPETMFNSSGLSHLLAYPEKMIEMLGLNLDNFNINKKRFPQGITVNGYEITPFPVLQVTEKHRWNQAQNLYKEIRQRENMEEIFFFAEDEIPFSIPYVTPSSDLRREGWSGDDEEGGEISPGTTDEFPF